jgi:exo-beta-1,3-glucanase (GH17 family)
MVKIARSVMEGHVQVNPLSAPRTWDVRTLFPSHTSFFSGHAKQSSLSSTTARTSTLPFPLPSIRSSGTCKSAKVATVA